MKLAFGLFALAAADGAQGAAAQDSSQGAQGAQGAQSQGAQSQGAQSQGAQGGGYGDDAAQSSQGGYGQQQQSYGGEPAESYAQEAHYAKAPDVCLTPCPLEAPCQHPSGGCVAKNHYEAHFEAPQQSYAAQSYGSQQSYGGQAQQSSGYRHLEEGQCPHGTEDTSGNALSSNIVLWIGFALLFIPALWFLCFMFEDLTDDGKINGSPNAAGVKAGVGMHRIVAGFICVFASLAYLTMATGHGYITRCCDGRSFYYARYIDWTLTTPLMLWELASLARGFNTLNAAGAPAPILDVSRLDTVFLLFMDVLMIIAGLIGSLICGSAKWAFWGFGVLAFIPILTTLCRWDNELSNAITAAVAAAPVADPIFGTNAASALTRYRQAMNITVITWFFYPIVWIVAEGTGTLSANAEAICYTVLDVIAKSVFGLIVIRNM